MPEVVLAYAEADEGAAARVISKLEKGGYKVTRDEAGRSARRSVTTKAAPPVLLLWSRSFAKTNLLPKRPLATLRLDAAPPPPMVKAPTIDLRAWRGREDHRGWRKLVGALTPAVAAKTIPGKAAAAARTTRATKAETKMSTPSEPSQKSSRLDALIFMVFLAIAGGGGYYALFMQK